MTDWKQSSNKEPSRLKQTVENIFGLTGQRTGSSSAEDNMEGRVEASRFFSGDVLKMIGCEVPRAHRLRALKELHELVSTKRLEKHAVEAVWSTIQDLIDPHQPRDVRHQAFKFLSSLIQGQYSYLGVLQGHFFLVLKAHRVQEDLLDRLDLLQVLTQGGKDVQYIGEDIGAFMAEWMPAVMSSAYCSVESRRLFITILVNLVHFNAVYLETEHVQLLVQSCGRYLAANTDPEIIGLVLDFLSSLVCFGCLSARVLEAFVVALCWVLNCERFCTRSWDVMRKLLGTHLGHSTLVTLQRVVTERKKSQSEILVVRAAIFYISMGLWGPSRISRLGSSFSPYLPTLFEALETQQSIVVYEVSLSLLRLTKKYGADCMGPAEWTEIMRVLAVIDRHVQKEAGNQVVHTLQNTVDEIFSIMESFCENGCLIGVDSPFYQLVEESMAHRSLSSIGSLIHYKSKGISPDDPLWISKFNELLDQFYKRERRTEVRLKALVVLRNKLDTYLVFYEDLLMHDVLIPTLSSISSDPDPVVRKVAVEIMTQVCEICSPLWCRQLITSIHQVTHHCVAADRLQSSEVEDEEQKPAAVSHQDSKIAFFGLANLFKMKLGRLPPGIAVTIFELLVKHLIEHYNSGYHSDASSLDHLVIFELILHLHANEDGHIGFGEGEKSIDCSPFILCPHSPLLPTRASRPGGRKMSDTRRWGPVDPVVLNYRDAYTAIVLCLEKEPQWEVLQSVLIDLPQWLTNLNLLILSDVSLDMLCCGVCSLLARPGEVLQRIRSKPRGSLIDELRSLVLPVLSALCPYADRLQRTSQDLLIQAFQQGLVSQETRFCVNSLTVCLLEMQQVMAFKVVAILLKLTQATASRQLAVPVLEFLHGLCSLPVLYKGFIENQYLLAFAILVPYTDAYKYPRFVVCLAYRVLSLWFIRSRMQYRRSIAQFIIKKLAANGGPLAVPPDSPASDDKDSTSQFHSEMMQVCLDLLARYTYSIISSRPKRSPLSDFLITGGPSKTWLVSSFLVTVTTSGSSGYVGGGQCGRCALVRSGLLGGREQRRSASTLAEEPAAVLCGCWSRGWAEVKVRRPTGSVSWLMRVQNQLDLFSSPDPLLTSHLGRDIGIAEVNTADLVSESSSLPCQPPSMSSADVSVEEEGEEEEEEQEDEEGPLPRDTSTPELLQPLGNPRLASWQAGQGTPPDEEREEPAQQGSSPPSGQSEDNPAIKPTSGSGRALTSERVPSNPIAMSVVRFDHRHRASASSDLCEFFPPLLSYEGNTRSPSLHSDSTLLNEQQQLNVLATMSEGTLSQSESTQLESSDFEGELGMEVGSEDDLLAVEPAQTQLSTSSPHNAQQPLRAQGESPPDQEPLLPSANSTRSAEPGLVEDSNFNQGSHFASTTSGHGNQGLGVIVPELQNDGYHSNDDGCYGNDDCFHSSEQDQIPADLGNFSEGEAPNEAPGNQPNKDCSSDVRSSTKSGPLLSRILAQQSRESELRNVFTDLAQPGGGSAQSSQERELLNNPSFVFLELYYSSMFGPVEENPPILLPSDEAAERAIKVLDHIPPYAVHKMGVVYVAADQTSERAILGNTVGSSRYLSFLSQLGSPVDLATCDPDLIYLGGLDRRGADGEQALLWHDEVTQVVLHVATLMPNSLSDGSHSNKKLHIGNDFVTIVYNNSSRPYSFGTIKGQFNFFEVLIDPLPYGLNRVYVQARKGFEDKIECKPVIISDKRLPLYVRLLSVHANMARMMNDETGSNWLERLHQINRLRSKYSSPAAPSPPPQPGLLDFTAFTS